MKTKQTRSSMFNLGSWIVNVRHVPSAIFHLPSPISILFLPLLLLALPAAVQAQDYTYTTNAGTITITGYTGPGGAVTIPSTINGLPVTSIGDWAFNWCTSLTTVTIPDSVTNIGARAFSRCSSLASVTIPIGVTNIGDYAFEDCTSLTSITIPDSVTSIGERVFSGCSSLSKVTIPKSVTSIGDWAFHLCIRLSVITVDANNPVYSSVDGVLFNQNQTALIQYPAGKAGSDYTIPNSVTNIGHGVFFHCSGLTSVTIPNSVTSIGGWAFSGCSSLTNVMIGNSVTSIGDRAFFFCTSLTNVTIPNSVTNIGNYAFCSCSRLAAIMVDTNNLAYSSVDGVLFNKNQIALIQYPAGKAGSHYTIPDSVTSIGGFAFSYCTSLTSITIPNSVTSIGDAEILWPGAFYGCYSLTNVTIGNSVTYIGDCAFADCPSLTKVYFKGSAPSVGLNVFLNDDDATVYYLPGTTGWGPTFADRRTALWSLPNPLILNNGSSFGVQPNGFGFIISWATNIPVVVEASTSPVNPTWSPLRTNTLTDGWSYFSDPQWTNYPTRFYRLRSP